MRSTSEEGALAVGRKEVGRGAVHDEGEEDGRVEAVAFGAGSWRMRIYPSVETEAARGQRGSEWNWPRRALSWARGLQ